MKNKMIKGLVVLGLLLAGLVVMNTGANVEKAQACVGINWYCGRPSLPGSSGGNGAHPEQNTPIPRSIPIDYLD